MSIKTASSKKVYSEKWQEMEAQYFCIHNHACTSDWVTMKLKQVLCYKVCSCRTRGRMRSGKDRIFLFLYCWSHLGLGCAKQDERKVLMPFINWGPDSSICIFFPHGSAFPLSTHNPAPSYVAAVMSSVEGNTGFLTAYVNLLASCSNGNKKYLPTLL